MKTKMVAPVTVDPVCYRVGGNPCYLHSGEFHYFRVPRKDWRYRMRLFKAAGGNCLATYVPWLIHEPEEGRFDFNRRNGAYDLEGFLATAAEEGLYVIIRPGPYQYSELKHSGLPAWICTGYPEMHAHNIDGKSFLQDAISYLHPEFLEKVRRWFSVVCPLIAPFTVSRGGTVAFAQFDNELGGIHYWFGSVDYNATTMGIGTSDGRYPSFLKARYGTIERVNGVYGTEYKTFAEARPLAPAATTKLTDLRRMRDYFQFYGDTLGDYGAILIAMMREFGLDVPFVHNSGGSQTNAGFKKLAAAMPGQFVLGADHYYTLGPDWPQNNPTPQHAVQMFCSLEMLRMMGFPPSVWELPGGSMSDWPPITGLDGKACYLMNAAYGMKGSNYYILTGGPNVPGTGVTCDVYDYCASIGPRNEIRPLYKSQKEFGLFMKRRPWLVEAERECDCRVAYEDELPMAGQYWLARGDLSFTKMDLWTFMQKGVLSTAFCASLSPSLFDLDAGDWVDDIATPVIVPSSAVMARAHQEKLVRFLKNGGRVLLVPIVPTLDENLEPCTILADVIGNVRQVATIPRRPVRVNVAGIENIWNNGEIWLFEQLNSKATILGVEAFSGKPLAAQWAVGAGTLAVLGFRWGQSKREHEAMLKALMKMLGCRPKVVCSNPNVWTSLRTVGGKSVLFLINLFTSPMEVEVTCRPAWSRKMISAGSHRVPGMTVETVELVKD